MVPKKHGKGIYQDGANWRLVFTLSGIDHISAVFAFSLQEVANGGCIIGNSDDDSLAIC